MKPRLLFIAHMVPFPEYNGAASRTMNLLRQLAKGFDVRVLPFFRRPQHESSKVAEDAVAGLRGLGVEVEPPSPVPSDWSTVRRALMHPRSAMTGKAFGPLRFESAEFERRVALAAGGGIHLVHFDTLDLIDHAEGLHHAPMVVNHHDIDSVALRRRAEKQRNRIMAWYLGRQADAYESLERKGGARFALNVVCSEREKCHLKRIAPAASVAVVPNGVDTEYFQPMPRVAVEPHSVVFVGGLDMGANLDGLHYFATSIWPLVRASIPDAQLHVVGRATEDRIRKVRGVGIVFEGLVPDIRPHLARVACVVVPLRLGGGTRLKILHAWGMEKAIVSTSVGAEGLIAEDGENLLVRDEPGAFAQGVVEILTDATLRSRLGAGGRQAAETHYDWNVIGERARAAYSALL